MAIKGIFKKIVKLISIGHKGLILLCLLSSINFTYAQQDTTKSTEILPTTDSSRLETNSKKVKKKNSKARPTHSVKKAVIYGLLIPGGGQIYNRKYWKLPIVYAGIGGIGYWVVSNHQQYICYRRSYLARVDSNSRFTTACLENSTISTSNLKALRDQSQANFELSVVAFAGFYILTVVDAFVDAHLMNFDISDDLSLSVKPRLRYNSFQPTVQSSPNQWTGSLSLQFKWKTPQKVPPISFY